MSDRFELPADPDPIEIALQAVCIQQPIGDLYVVKMDYKVVQRVTFFDVRRVLRDERDVERYLGIQRPLNEARVRELRDYVNFVDATFPTSVILAADADYVRYDKDNGTLILSNTREGEDEPSISISNLCKVIDGQHRIAGLEGFKPTADRPSFDLLVSLFVGMDVADQSYVFATVNLEQTKVNKSLAFDLYELAKSRSPYKTCHNIAVALDASKSSPLHHRIKRLGVATEGRGGETLTQATVVNSIVRYISDDPKLDRDLLLRGQKLREVSGNEAKRLCFRNSFIHGDDLKIGKIIEQYFLAVAHRWPDAWNNKGVGNILNKTNGFRALMAIFGRVYNRLASPGDFVSESEFLTLFKKVKHESDYFNVENFKPGTSGESALRRLLEEQMLSYEAGRLFD